MHTVFTFLELDHADQCENCKDKTYKYLCPECIKKYNSERYKKKHIKKQKISNTLNLSQGTH